MVAKTKNRKRKTENVEGQKASRGAQTMDELLARYGSAPRRLSRGQIIEGTVIEIGTKSLVCDIAAKSEGLVVDREFEAARTYIRTLKIGDKVKAVVLVPEAEAGQVLLSVGETAEEYVWQMLGKKFERKEEVEAKVLSVGRGGISVDVCGLQGFIPSGQLGSAWANNVQGLLGRILKVKIIDCDKGGGRLVLSEKAVSEAEVLAKQMAVINKIKEGEKMRGKVSALTDFGAFVEVEKEGVVVSGLVHVSEISWAKVSSSLLGVLKEGQDLDVVVIGKEAGRLSLSVKRLQVNPWENVDKKYKVDEEVAGRVTKVGDFGAFVELEPGIEGLVQLGKIPAGKTLSEGDVGDFFIEGINKESKRLALGLVLKKAPVGYK